MTKSEQTKFRRWLSGQRLRSDNVGWLAREAARGKVKFDGRDDPHIRAILFEANLHWRAAGNVCPKDNGGCGHPASVHGNTDDGDNIGPCSTPGCQCPGVPDGGVGEDPADNESSRTRRRPARAVKRQVAPSARCPQCRKTGGQLRVNSDQRGVGGMYHHNCWDESRGRPDRSAASPGFRIGPRTTVR